MTLKKEDQSYSLDGRLFKGAWPLECFILHSSLHHLASEQQEASDLFIFVFTLLWLSFN